MSADVLRFIDQPEASDLTADELLRAIGFIGDRVNEHGIDATNVRWFELMKDFLFGLTDTTLVHTASTLGVQPTNKAVINAFINRVLPDFSTRTLSEQAENLSGIEVCVLDHFRTYDITATTVGSFGILGNPSTSQSDYDVFVVAEDGREDALIAAMQNLPHAGVQGFDTNENGGIQGANLVVNRGNEGYGFARGLTTEIGRGTVVEIFIFGEHSLPSIPLIGGQVEKVQEGKQRWAYVKDLSLPGTVHTIVEPPPGSWKYTCWPQVGEVHGVSFYENLALTMRRDGHDPRGLLELTRMGVFDTAAGLMRRYGHVNGSIGEAFITALGYNQHSNFDPNRRQQVLDDFYQAVQRIS